MHLLYICIILLCIKHFYTYTLKLWSRRKFITFHISLESVLAQKNMPETGDKRCTGIEKLMANLWEILMNESWVYFVNATMFWWRKALTQIAWMINSIHEHLAMVERELVWHAWEISFWFGNSTFFLSISISILNFSFLKLILHGWFQWMMSGHGLYREREAGMGTIHLLGFWNLFN